MTIETTASAATQYAATRVKALQSTASGSAPHTTWLLTLENRAHLETLLKDAYLAGATAAAPPRG